MLRVIVVFFFFFKTQEKTCCGKARSSNPAEENSQLRLAREGPRRENEGKKPDGPQKRAEKGQKKGKRPKRKEERKKIDTQRGNEGKHGATKAGGEKNRKHQMKNAKKGHRKHAFHMQSENEGRNKLVFSCFGGSDGAQHSMKKKKKA